MYNTTYYQRNKDEALNKAKEYNKNNNKRLKKQAKDIYIETYLKKTKMKKENMEKIDIIIYLKKRSKN